MVDFRRTTSTSNYLGQREQRRLLLLVLALGLVILAMQEAAKPQRWYWLWQGDLPREAEHAAVESFDTRLPAPVALAADEILVLPPEPDEQSDAFALPSGVQAELLESVHDDTIFRGAEHAAWFHFFDLLAHRTDEQLADESLGVVTFAQLYRQPASYRGRLVMLQGRLRRAVWQPAPKNEQGLAGYYQTWLQPDDNPADPIVIYALELPPDMPTGSDILVEVSATGYFFKRWVYEAPGALRVAPVVLARTVEPRTPILTAPSAAPNNPWWLVAGGVLLASGVVLYLMRSERARPSHFAQPETIVPPSTDEHLDALDEDRAPSGVPTEEN